MHALSPTSFPYPSRLPASLRIAPMPPGFLARVRAGTDDQGQPVERHTARGGEPLRDCLRRALPGEPILLASFCPFTLAGPYREYGPVFVSAAEQGPPALDVLPLAGDQPYLGEMFVLRAYSQDERIVYARLSSPGTAIAELTDFLLRPEVDFVLVRYPAYGCYALRIGRA